MIYYVQTKIKRFGMNTKELLKYLTSLLLFGLNGIVADQIPLNGYEIVLLRTLIGSMLLLMLFFFSKREFHIMMYKKDAIFISLSGISTGISRMFLYEAYFREIL